MSIPLQSLKPAGFALIGLLNCMLVGCELGEHEGATGRPRPVTTPAATANPSPTQTPTPSPSNSPSPAPSASPSTSPSPSTSVTPSPSPSATSTPSPSRAPVTGVYDSGSFAVSRSDIAEGESGAPRDLTIYAPNSTEAVPVVQFQHGFVLDTDFFSGILTHLASHGFVVVAPQMYPPGNPGNAPSIAEEVEGSRAVLQWLSTQLATTISTPITTNNIGIAGHSRGGQVAWRVSLADPSAVSGIAGVDPVDGEGDPFSGDTGPLVTDSPFGLPFPSLVLGTGLGPEAAFGGLSPPCAPDGQNHEQFFAASAPPAWHLIADEHGHNDMLDDSCGVECLACSSGPDLPAMRRFVAGQLVAYFSHVQKGFDGIDFLSNSSPAPLAVSAEQK